MIPLRYWRPHKALSTPEIDHVRGSLGDDTDHLLDNHDGRDQDAESDRYSTGLAPPQASMASSDSRSTGMGRHLGLFSTTLLIVNRMIGNGIFSTPSSIANSVGSVGATLSLWVAGFLLSSCGLLVWIELGCMFPKSGGEKIYLEAAYPRPHLLAPLIFAFHTTLLSFVGAGSIVCAENLLVAINATATNSAKRTLAIFIFLSIIATHTLAPKAGVRIMNTFGFIKIIILVFIILTGWVISARIDSHLPPPQLNLFSASLFANSSGNVYDYATALLKVLATYQGWSNASYVLGEVKDPARTLKIAGPLGLGMVGLLYILANISYFTVATPDEVAQSGVIVAAFFFGKVFGPHARRVAAMFAAMSSIGNIMTTTFTMSRVNQELAKEGMLPFSKLWASNWPRGSPTAAMLLVFLSSFIVIIGVPFGDAYNFLLDIGQYGNTLIYLLTAIGLFIIRARNRKESLHNLQVRWQLHHFQSALFHCPTNLVRVFIISQIFIAIGPFIPPKNGAGDTSLPFWLSPTASLLLFVSVGLVWYVWRRLLPLVGGFRWVQIERTLQDGTQVMEWRREPQSTLLGRTSPFVEVG